MPHKMYNIMAAHLLLYRCESWLLKTSQLKEVESAGMQFLRLVKGSTLRDHIPQ